MKDKKIKCKDCGKDFVFTKEEQKFYKDNGFNEVPKRCKKCIEKIKKLKTYQ